MGLNESLRLSSIAVERTRSNRSTVAIDRELDELAIHGTSGLADAFRNFIKKGKESADNIKRFFRFKLLKSLKQMTTKGIALFVGMPVKSTQDPSEFTEKGILKFLSKKVPKKLKITGEILVTAGGYFNAKDGHRLK